MIVDHPPGDVRRPVKAVPSFRKSRACRVFLRTNLPATEETPWNSRPSSSQPSAAIINHPKASFATQSNRQFFRSRLALTPYGSPSTTLTITR